MSQFPRCLRVGDYVLIHYRTGNRAPRPTRARIDAKLVQGALSVQLPTMDAMLDPFEAINLHLFVPIDGRFGLGEIRLDSRFEAAGVRRASHTAHLDRLQIVGRRAKPFMAEARLLPSVDAEKLAALYIGAMELADLGRILDDWDERASNSLEAACRSDALALHRAVLSSYVAPLQTATGRELLACYVRDPRSFRIGYARRDLPYMLGWHLRPTNPIAPIIRADGFTFRSERASNTAANSTPAER